MLNMMEYTTYSQSRKCIFRNSHQQIRPKIQLKWYPKWSQAKIRSQKLWLLKLLTQYGMNININTKF